MLINTGIAFATRCDLCGRIKIHNISLFDFSSRGEIELKCSCGHTNAIIKTKNYKTFWMKISCIACEDMHVFRYTLRQLLRGNIVTRCIETGMEICFIGEEEDVTLLVNEYEKESEELLKELGFYDYFVNFDVMVRCINRIKQLDGEGKIICECDSDSIEIDLYPDRIELKCMECNSIQVVYAENEEDLKHLFEKKEIIMHKHRFQCIDAINQNKDKTTN